MRLFRLTLLLFCACSAETDEAHYADGDTSAPDDNSPPDDADDAAHAEEIVWDEPEAGTLDNDDSDWYRVSGVLAGQHFRVQVVNDDENASEDSLDTVVEVFDEAMERIAWEDDHPVGDVGTYDTVCFGFFPTAGTYYLRVTDRGTFEGVERDVDETDYTVTLLAPTGPPAEPDSLLRLGLAFGMENTNSWYALAVQADEPGDVDYVRLELAHANGAMTFASSHHIESSAYTPAITLFDFEGTPVLSAASLTETDFRQYISPPSTTYVLGVADSTGVSGPAEGMWLFIANGEAGVGYSREVEPNDSTDGPMELTLADQNPSAGYWEADFVEGRIATAGDQDWYSFTLTDDRYVTIELGALSYGSLLEASVEVHGDELVVAGSAVEGVDPDVRTTTKLPAGRYTVSVAPTDGVTGGEGSFYRVAVHATSVPL